MITIDFGPNGGGKKGFNNIERLQAFVEKQRTAWGSRKDWFERTRNLPNIRRLADDWFAVSPAAIRQQNPSFNDESILNTIRTVVANTKPISTSSQVGSVIEEMLGAGDWIGADGALRLSRNSNEQLNSLPASAILGAVTYKLKMAGIDVGDEATARSDIARLKAELSDDVTKTIADLAQVDAEHRRSLEALNEKGEAARVELEQRLGHMSDAASEQRSQFQVEWKQTHGAFVEQLRIEAPVKLWSNRAVELDRHAVRLRRWCITTGLIGLLLAAGVSAASLAAAKWLYSDAWIAAAKATPAEAHLRPTFHFELISAAAATLLYLTLYFWAMRVLVRLYTTEHHLAIDARARASMAETYLALIKEGAASDADRAIVLASLFRPVMDGMVKDDGPPPVTPAALIATLATGKTGS